MKALSVSVSVSLLFAFSYATPSPSLSGRSGALNKRAVNVLTPTWGYMVNYPGNHTEISWTEPTTRDLRITLMKGAPGQLVGVGPYDSFVDNDGRYEWLNEDYDDTDLKSGCDYKFRIAIQEDEDDFGESEYFVVVREGDGGLTPDTMCPGRRGDEGTLVRFGDLAGLSGQNTASGGSPETTDSATETGGTTTDTGETTTETGATTTETGVTSSASGSETGSVQSDDSVSTTTLIIAVVVSDVGILLLFAAVVFFGRRRSWFVSRYFLANYLEVMPRAQARTEEENRFGKSQGQGQGQGQTYVGPNGNAVGKGDGFVHVVNDGSQGTYRSISEVGGRNVKIAQLE